jgi:hypothetical protein
MGQRPVKATPAKRFFVEMLTRDIELSDAILDLLDNCVDGALRSIGGKSDDVEPYKGYWAKINLSGTEFSIEDNCGGIPQDLAENYAFRLGRPDPERDRDIPTVGVYGIGMKRAIFKMGYSSEVKSQTDKGSNFAVRIPRDWMDDDAQWELQLDTGAGALPENGTRIAVNELRDGVARMLGDETGFVEDLRRAVSAYYGYIIAKGFKVEINNQVVEPLRVTFLTDEVGVSGESEALAPYAFEAKVDGVDVSVTVGLYSQIGNNDDDEPGPAKPSVDKAGWTIICNDRVVLYSDKTKVTGWGDASVPAYHPQFVSIAGVVIFKSNDAKKLPVTTTKRGVEGNSELYLAVKNVMRDGLKQFTDFTNRWKSPSEERTAAMKGASASYLAQEIVEHVPDASWKQMHGELGGRLFRPKLPRPRESNPVRSIQYSRLVSEIEEVRRYFYDDIAVSNSQVGTKCFDYVLERVRK